MNNNSYTEDFKQNNQVTKPNMDNAYHSHSSFQYQQLELSRKLQSTLDPERMLHLFLKELQGSFDITGINYQLPKDDLFIRLGRTSEVRTSRHIKVEEECLGTIVFFSSRECSENCQRRLQKLISMLHFPLRNAISYQRLKRSSQTDHLTGAGNRAALDASLRREYELARRNGLPLSILMIDLDHFKKINDRFGHHFGDTVLKEVVREVQKIARATDAVFRFGGEEFTITLNNTNAQGAMAIAQRIRRAIEQLCIKTETAATLSISVSIGAATLNTAETADEMLERADSQLYLAKSKGRNQVCGQQPFLVKHTVAANETINM